MKKFFLLPAVLALLCLNIGAQTKTMVVATGDYPPFEFRDEKGELAGYDIELGQEIARRMEVRIKWVQMDFSKLLPALDAGQADLVIAAVHATEERRQRYEMSRKYVNSGLVMVVKKGNKKINSLSQLKGCRVAVKQRATGEKYARENAAQLGFEFKSFSTTDQSFAALHRGEVDAVFNDYLSSRFFIKQNPEYKIPIVPFTPCGMAVAAAKGRKSLIMQVNQILDELERTGFLKQLYQKWLL
ncbi:amino acid ABC transporter substrate-binding protein [candidate division TA06 bacterium]|nr:amino acid ABC transporter substrate-binding protein [candidate division TA06 bacterium]